MQEEENGSTLKIKIMEEKIEEVLEGGETASAYR